MPRPLAARRATAILAAASALALAPASPAAAEPTWYGQHSATVPLCFSGTPATGVVGKAWLQADPAAPTRVGDVFYASVTAGTVAKPPRPVRRPRRPPPCAPASVPPTATAATPTTSRPAHGPRSRRQGCGSADARRLHCSTRPPRRPWPRPPAAIVTGSRCAPRVRWPEGWLSPARAAGGQRGGRPPCRPDQAGTPSIGVWVIDGCDAGSADRPRTGWPRCGRALDAQPARPTPPTPTAPTPAARHGPS